MDWADAGRLVLEVVLAAFGMVQLSRARRNAGEAKRTAEELDFLRQTAGTKAVWENDLSARARILRQPKSP